TVSGDKNHEVSYYSMDSAGNKEEVITQSLKIDSETPVTTSDIEDQWNQTEIKVELSAIDNLSGVAKTYYSVDGSDYVEGTSFTVSGDKIHEVSYYSVDHAGNKEEIKSQKVKIDGETPKTSDNHSEIWAKTDVEVVLKAEDNLSGVSKTYYSINGSEYTLGTNFKITKEGINEVKYYSVDVARNKEDIKTILVKVDMTAPVINAGINEEYMLGSEFGISYSTVEEHSGVAVEEVTLNGVAYKNGDTVNLDEPGVYTLTIKVTDHAGWTTTFEKEFVVYIPLTLEVLPKVIKGNKGIFTVKANLPQEFSGSTFAVSTATLNGVAPKLDNNGLTKQAEKGHFKFEREDFDWKPGKVELQFRSYLENGYLVVGSTIVDVK
ncbi:Ig-like domain repeat protein, partial [Bacillus sp. JJ1609]|uniref:OmpL47-type beta-barrel domain-containing protein n=1 Tax=Bacillus sp. JJ1609 TaxID=3122977 RepID=UPI0030004DE8